MTADLSWDEVKTRSLERIEGIGACFCWDCDLNYGAVQMPCAKHCITDEERVERDRRFGAKIVASPLTRDTYSVEVRE